MENKIEIPKEIIVVKDVYHSLSKEKKSNLLSLLNDWLMNELIKLSFEEIEEELPKKGQVVWVRDRDDEKWVIQHFIEKRATGYASSFRNDTNNYNVYRQITTKNPYAVEEEVSILETTDREPKVGDMVFAWDYEEVSIVTCGELLSIGKNVNYPYSLPNTAYKYCSLKNPLIK